jgi:predicted phosphate transport protein (TIGR00153 family)
MRLLPHDGSFFDSFEALGKYTVEGCRALLLLLESKVDVASQAERIAQIEEACDDITHQVIAQLHKTFITPLDRNDIYRLTTKMDDIMDYVDAVADRFALYELPSVSPDLVEMARCLIASAENVLQALQGLRNLKDPEAVLQRCIEINRQENVADKILRSALANLFKHERDPVLLMKWKEILETMEATTDRCEDVANIIEGIVLENS